MLYTSQHNDTLNSGTEPDIVTAKKGIVNQGSEELPCITIDEIKLALRKTKNNKAPGDDSCRYNKNRWSAFTVKDHSTI